MLRYNGGGNWIELNMKNFPRVAVHDIIIHPRDNDIILATHGRSLWVFDDATPIQFLNDNVLAKDTHIFNVRPAYRFTTRFTRYGIGDEPFQGENPPKGALITYYLKNEVDKKTPIKLEIFDSNGVKVSEVKNLPKERGLNRTVWNLSYEGAKLRKPPPPEQIEFLDRRKVRKQCPEFTRSNYLSATKLCRKQKPRFVLTRLLRSQLLN